MPLTQSVTFKTMLQKQNRLQVPLLVRWKFRLESSEVLKVTVNMAGMWGNEESFLARILKDGRIVVPKLTLALLKGDESSVEGQVMEVTLEPA